MNTHPDSPWPVRSEAVARHRPQSRQRSRERWRGRTCVSPDWVKYDFGDRSLEIKLSMRDVPKLESIQKGLLGPVPDGERYSGSWTEMEVLDPQGRYGTLVRIVRRGFYRDGSGADDLAEFVFRVRKSPAVLRCGDLDFDVHGHQELAGSAFTRPITASVLVSLFEAAAHCTVTLGGELLWVQSLYHQSRLHFTERSDGDRQTPRAEMEVCSVY